MTRCTAFSRELKSSQLTTEKPLPNVIAQCNQANRAGLRTIDERMGSSEESNPPARCTRLPLTDESPTTESRDQKWPDRHGDCWVPGCVRTAGWEAFHRPVLPPKGAGPRHA